MIGRRPVSQRVVAGIAGIVVALSGSAPAHADPDTDFAAQLHSYGIYGAKDYNAWIGKIACQRLDNGVDRDAYQSANFVAGNLDRHNSIAQTWQFLSAAIGFYCPERRSVLESVAGQR
ncbi:hypothetical protein A5630_04385 [Mycolicibacterium mucogenicum]|uniref:DUF732 domain-containing protein n=1 Tax=Mycolicibacterium mucogenicum TaxID=56689 RepID=A0A1A3GNU3_MYCMU|nr:DUF732 domain-containing protein [Mycolicibacterium mucogenicum]OBJ37510.1 hypothetical protein A5630_04385 [Mycolicibacterium mucogenicum]